MPKGMERMKLESPLSAEELRASLRIVAHGLTKNGMEFYFLNVCADHAFFLCAGPGK